MNGWYKDVIWHYEWLVSSQDTASYQGSSINYAVFEKIFQVDFFFKNWWFNRISRYFLAGSEQLNMSCLYFCRPIEFSRKVKRSFSSSYHLSVSQLSKVASIKDLGVILDSKLTFNLHRKRCFNKALKMLGFIFRNCKDCGNVHSFKVLYYAHVRSHLEYCCQVWNPDVYYHILALPIWY